MHLGSAFIIVVLAWCALRSGTGAPLLAPLRSLAPDFLPVLVVWLWLAAITARPLAAAEILALLVLGLLRANTTKLLVTNEPLVFSDAHLLAIAWQPRLYCQFVNPVRHGLAAVIVVAAALFMFAQEAPFWGVAGSTVAALAGTGAWVAGRRWQGLRSCLGRLVPSTPLADPGQNIAALGPIAGTLAQAAMARTQRRRLVRIGPLSRQGADEPPDGPVVMLQLESFFDPRKLGLAVPPGLMAQYDRLASGSLAFGSMATPAFGANTIRTEFAALTGLPEDALGLDRFNPYAAFGHSPIDTIAWRLRDQGFHTVCIHPFDRTFYRRDEVMPNLGFDRFIAIDEFADDRPGAGYVPDIALMRKVGAVLELYGPQTFVFAISIGNHSPWPAVAGNGPLPGFLAGLAATDAALGFMAQTLQTRFGGATLAAFGDHQPQIDGIGKLRDISTDYLIWRDGQGAGRRQDILAHALPAMTLRAAASVRPALPAVAVPAR